MSSNIAIRVENLSKCYQIYDRPHDRLKQSIIPRFQRLIGQAPTLFYREFWAIQQASFEIEKGETVGIIGRNGSGKSTLLQLICGTLNPTYGSIQTSGRVAALLELGSGFNPEFTGRENVFLSASLLGLTKRQIAERFDRIIAFADIGDFVDQPVKIYSSGMFVRLAFAVIAHVDADILVIDEALAVGDAFFVQKCMRFLRSFTEHGTLLFVSHDTTSVVGLCSKAMLLNAGRIERIGSPKDVSEYYLAMIHGEQLAASSPGEIREDLPADETQVHADDSAESPPPALENSNDFGTGAAHIVSAVLAGENGRPIPFFAGGETACLDILFHINATYTEPLVGFLVRDRLGQVVFGGNSSSMRNGLTILEKGQTIKVRFTFVMPCLQHGEYTISVAIGQGCQEEHTHHHWKHDALVFKSVPEAPCFGMLATELKDIVFSRVK